MSIIAWQDKYTLQLSLLMSNIVKVKTSKTKIIRILRILVLEVL